MRKVRRKGLTLIELVMLILIIGILATIAITRYANIQVQATIAAELEVVRGVRSGILSYYAANRGFPAVLDHAANGNSSAANPFFGEILNYGIAEDWVKNGNVYRGPGGGTYTYDSVLGSFS